MSDDGEKVDAIPVSTTPTPATSAPSSRKSKRRPVSIEHAVDEGLLIARSALTMEVKNRIIVDAIADGRPYDDDHVRAVVRQELTALVDENAAAAERMTELAAKVLTARGAHTREGYQAGDHESLASRGTIHTRMAERLREFSSDEGYLDAVAERARDQAWSEVGDAIQSRLIRTLPVTPDRFYEEEKAARIKALYDINLRALEKRARKAAHHHHKTLDAAAGPAKVGLGRLIPWRRREPRRSDGTSH